MKEKASEVLLFSKSKAHSVYTLGSLHAKASARST